MRSPDCSPGTHATRDYPLRVTLVTIVVLIGGLFTLLGFHTSGHRPDLWIPLDALNLGDVWAQDGLRVVLPFHNSSGADINLDHIRPSCKCASVEPPTLTVPAKG